MVRCDGAGEFTFCSSVSWVSWLSFSCRVASSCCERSSPSSSPAISSAFITCHRPALMLKLPQRPPVRTGAQSFACTLSMIDVHVTAIHHQMKMKSFQADEVQALEHGARQQCLQCGLHLEVQALIDDRLRLDAHGPGAELQ